MKSTGLKEKRKMAEKREQHKGKTNKPRRDGNVCEGKIVGRGREKQ